MVEFSLSHRAESLDSADLVVSQNSIPDNGIELMHRLMVDVEHTSFQICFGAVYNFIYSVSVSFRIRFKN